MMMIMRIREDLKTPDEDLLMRGRRRGGGSLNFQVLVSVQTSMCFSQQLSPFSISLPTRQHIIYDEKPGFDPFKSFKTLSTAANAKSTMHPR